MDNQIEGVQRRTHYLSWFQRFSYSIGHVFNDLCAAFWFTYLMIFMRKVNGFDEKTSGALMLVGQIADGIATPFIGLECDKNFTWWICRYGKRKAWHLVGSICVLFSFPFIFNLCWGCYNSTESAQVIYYSAFILIFQFGWASVQISHLSLIPDLTPVSSERIELNAFRYAFTVFANISVFVMMWIVLDTSTGTDQISVRDAETFKIVSFVIIAIGSLFTIVFHVGTKEKINIEHENSDDDKDGSVWKDTENDDFSSGGAPYASQNELVYKISSQMKWKNWFFISQFYFVGILYMGTRLTINLTQVYIPQYLQETLHMSKKSIAYIPLVIYSSGFVSSFVMKWINIKLGKMLTYLIGSILFIAAAIWIMLGNSESFKHFGIFVVSVLIGLSSSTQLITSLGITNDLIGHNTSSGAFVFGAMSLLDKISNGLSVMIIEVFKPPEPCIDDFCKYYYRNVLTFFCGGSTILALIGLFFLSSRKLDAHKIVRRRRRKRAPHRSRTESVSSPLLSNYED